MDVLAFKKFVARMGDPDRLAPEIRKGIYFFPPLHFDRDGRKLCDCCVLEGISKYGRIRQFNLDGGSYLVVCDTVHGRTRYDEQGTPVEYGTLRDVFSQENMRTAEIFEIDRSKLDRSDLAKGQRQLKGEERDALIKRLLTNEGELLQLSKVEREINGKWEIEGYYLGDEERPRMQEGSIFVSVVS